MTAMTTPRAHPKEEIMTTTAPCTQDPTPATSAPLLSLPWYLVLTLCFGLALACDPEFEDDMQSELMKPELLSIVLEPPEAAPGDLVRASFLYADERGVIPDPTVVWMPLGSGDGAEDASDDQVLGLLATMGLAPDDLLAPSLAFTLPREEAFVFDEDGIAESAIAVSVAGAEPRDEFDSPLAMPAAAETFLTRDDVQPGLRTLVVSTRETRNQNPLVDSLTVSLADAGDDAARVPLSFLRHDDQELALARGAAADTPFVIEEGSELVFHAGVLDDGEPEEASEALRYQWISTGNDFDGFRQADEAWTAPSYREPGEGETDQSGGVGVDVRSDPNLHPVWLIVRDNGIRGQLGQSWAEFYVRVVQAP